MSTLSSTVYAWGGGTGTGGGSTGTPPHSTGTPPHSTGGPPNTSGNTSAGTTGSTVSQQTGPTGGGDPDSPDPGDDPDSPGPGGGGGGGGSVTNITNNYYYLDVGLQFKPRVGVITSINNSADIIGLGSARQSLTANNPVEIPGTVWSPQLEDIPDIPANIGREYSYGVLYSGYWDTPLTGTANDMKIIVHSKPSDYDSTKASVERSWDNRDPEGVLSDDVGPESEGKEEFYTEYEKEIYNPIPASEAPKFEEPSNWDTKLDTKGSDGSLGPLSGGGSTVLDQTTILTPYTSKVWYREQDTIKTSQNSEFIQHYITPLSSAQDINDAMQRALNILGYDILLRDEWTTSVIYTIDNSNQKYFGYGYSNTNVLDTRDVLGSNLITTDYVMQSIYRALGVNCLRTETYFYADKDLTVDFTPLAEKITVAMDKINQVQNRVDVFVTRANLEDYWDKAIEDGVVSNSGIKVLNTIDAAYKPFAKKLGSAYVDKDTGLTYPAETWIEKISGADTMKVPKLNANGEVMKNAKGEVIYENVPNYKKIDYNRTKTMTLAEFCVYVKKMMDLYGEEVLTDKEMEILLVSYGTKLPYGLESEEQLEAIKYLMAKGIVSDSMYWEGDLTLEDMLVVLSRVKDEGSRLTFKNIEIEYDPDLVSMGYCPAEMTFVEETSIGVVSTTLNESYSYNNAEWFDYFLRMPKEVETPDKTKINPRFIATNGAQEYVTTDIFLVKAVDGEFNYMTSTAARDYDNIKIVGYENLEDGYEYLHVKIKTAALFSAGTNTPNPNYVDGKYIYINTTSEEDAPKYWKVDYRGGVLRNPIVKKKTNSSSGKNNEYYIVWGSSNHYTTGTKYNISKSVVDLSKYKLNLDDFDALAEYKTCKSLVTTLNIDGTVKTAYTYTAKKGTESDRTNEYMSFDQAGWEYKYCDYDRYINGLAISFTYNPMLSNNTSAAEALASMVPQYDIWFYILADTNDNSKLSTSIWINNEKIVEADKPKEIKMLSNGASHGIEYLAYNNGKYYYVARGKNTEKGLSDILRTDNGTSVSASYATGYIKQNNTFLIKDEDLFNIVDATSDIYENGSVTRLNDDVLCVSFDVKGADFLAQITHTIYLNEPLKLLSVNNMIYKIPDDEILFVDNTKSGGSYLLNYRAVLGWGSGYTGSFDVAQNGSVELALSVAEKNSSFAFSYQQFGLQNSYTGRSTPLVLIQKDGENFSVPASAPNNYSSWFVYQSDTDGTYAIVLKNNDKDSKNSVISELKADSTAILRYTEGNKWLYDIFGVTVGSGDPYNDDVLVSVYRLGIGNDAYEFSLNADGSIPKDAEISGKFYKDTNLCTWAYVPTEKKTYGYSMACSRLGSRTLNGGNVSASNSADETAKEVIKQDRDLQEAYYSCDMILPYYWSIDNKSSVIDMSCNIHKDSPYGSIFVYTIDFDDGTDTDSMNNLVNNGYICYSNYLKLSCPRKDKDNNIVYDVLSNAAVVNTTPANPLPLIMGIDAYKIGEDSEIKGTIRIAYGNYFYTYNSNWNPPRISPAYPIWGKDTASSDTDIKITTAYIYVIGVTMTKQIGFMSASGEVYTIDEEQRKLLIDKTTKAALQDLDQIGGVNWGAYTFDNLVHDVDNGLSILLIIVLNIIPRIGMFVFIILIGLSTVANMKPVQRFCDNIFDPYKLITLGHCTVYTINTKLLLISSIIGLAAFGLFMDGTLINLLTWLVQFVSAFVTR